MNKEFVTYEQALALKKLGVNEKCFAYFDYYDNRVPLNLKDLDWDGCGQDAPLKQQAFRWFREKYQLHSTITSISQESWQWHITKPGESLGKLYDEDFYTYEEAEYACIDKLIEIVKNESKED